jgi:NOL1/NOP2/fmu family ribosome biogenesis protein
MRVQILDRPKKEKFLEKTGLGIEKIPYLLLKPGRERVMAYSGSLSTAELSKLIGEINVEVIGLYLGKEFDEDARLSTDALHILKDKIKNNIAKINEEQEKDWFLGNPIKLTEKQKEEYKELKGFVAVKSQEDFIGTGKMAWEKGEISNFLPKERRVKQNQ